MKDEFKILNLQSINISLEKINFGYI